MIREVLLLVILLSSSLVHCCEFHNGAVTSDHPQCSAIGAEILRLGGSSVDASIATMICIGAANMFASGIGGGGFAMIRVGRETDFLDFREVAPAGSSELMFEGKGAEASSLGGMAIAVPGELKGFQAMHAKYGKLQWSELLAPTIRICRHEGIMVTPLQTKRYRFINGNKYLLSVFKPRDRWLTVGERFFLPALANTLEVIANNGVDAFYNGPLTASIVKTIQNNGGIITEKDLTDYQVERRTPLTSKYERFRIITGPPPTAGIIIIKALNIMEHFPCCDKDLLKNYEFWHVFVEALKFAYSSRFCLSDPKHSPLSSRLPRIIEKIIAKENATQDTSRIDLEKTYPPEHYFVKCANHLAASQGTSHVNVYGPDGIAVSMTSSINTPFGSMVIDEELGIIFNNHMDDFSSLIPNSYGLPPSPFNRPFPGKRPQSSCAPLIVTDDEGNFVASIGASGGSQIISAIIEVLTLIFQIGLPIDEAIGYPRIHHQLEPNEVVLEDPINPDLLSELERRGHKIRLQEGDAVKSAVSVIYRKQDGSICASNDPRKYSVPAFV